MKKLPLFSLFLAVILGLAACDGGSESAESRPGSDAPPSEAETAYVFPAPAADGYSVAIGEDMAEVLSHLGEPTSYFEAASCAFDGMDKTYTYSGFTITTRAEGEQDLVNSILLTDDSVTTAEGIYIGCSVQDVTAAYGAQAPEGNILTYTEGGVTLNFILKDDKVLSIEYFASGS